MGESNTFHIVYIIAKELPVFRDFQITESSLKKSLIEKVGTDQVCCIRKESGVWAVYLRSKDSQNKLINEGFSITELHCCGVENEKDIVICGLPLPVSQTTVIGILKKIKMFLQGRPDFTKLRFDGITFLHILPPTVEVCIPRNVAYHEKVYRIYHSRQKSVSCDVICYGKACVLCCQPNHIAYTNECPKYTEIIFNEDRENPLSPSHREEFDFDEQTCKSVAHALKMSKDSFFAAANLASNDNPSETDLVKKQIDQWKAVMGKTLKRILSAKYDQVVAMREKLEEVSNYIVFAYASKNTYWGTGLNAELTKITDSSKWCGQNIYGHLIKDLITLKFYTVNARGLKDHEKRIALHRWSLEQDIDVFLIQDTHFLNNEERNSFGSFEVFHCLTNSSYSRGVSVLLKNDVKRVNLEILFSSEDGRMLFVKLTYHKKSLTVINVYAPVKEGEKEIFFEYLLSLMNQYCEENNIILCGDLNSKIDICSTEKSVTNLGRIVTTHNLIDGWVGSGKFPSDGLTYAKSKTEKAKSRLDYVFLSKDIFISLDEISLLVGPDVNQHRFSDHIGIHFKMNTGMLQNKDSS